MSTPEIGARTPDFKHLVIRDLTNHFRARGLPAVEAEKRAVELVDRIDAEWSDLTRDASDDSTGFEMSKVQVSELIQRLTNGGEALLSLERSALRSGRQKEGWRLRGKAQGVKLALSYLMDYAGRSSDAS